MKSDDITKLGLLVAKVKGDHTQYDMVILIPNQQTLLYVHNGNGTAKSFTNQDLEYLAEQNEEAKFLITKLILNGDLS